MEKGLRYTFLKEVSTDVLWVHERYLTSLITMEMQIRSTRYYVTPLDGYYQKVEKQVLARMWGN